MKNYDCDSKDCMWMCSHTGINAVNIDMALEAKKRGMKVIVYGSASETGDKASRHSSGKNLFQLADIVDVYKRQALQPAFRSWRRHAG